jgi:hypothetical protein
LSTLVGKIDGMNVYIGFGWSGDGDDLDRYYSCQGRLWMDCYWLWWDGRGLRLVLVGWIC